AGAEMVLPHTFEYVEIRRNGVDRIPTLYEDPANVTLGTGHPQGGNPVGSIRGRSVVDRDFKVWGYENLHVCDASVFPSSIGVNPQLTVMALAHYASQSI